MPAQNCLRHLSTGACVWAFTVVILLLARAMNVAGCRPGSRDGIRWTYREFVANCKLIYIYIYMHMDYGYTRPYRPAGRITYTTDN